MRYWRLELFGQLNLRSGSGGLSDPIDPVAWLVFVKLVVCDPIGVVPIPTQGGQDGVGLNVYRALEQMIFILRLMDKVINIAVLDFKQAWISIKGKVND